MKKLFIMTHNLKGGGTERVLTTLANAFSADGLDVTIITEHAGESAYEIAPNVHRLSLVDQPAICRRDIPSAYLRLRRLVMRARPDAVLALPEKVNVWTVLFLIGSGVPVIVSERNDPSRHPESRIKRLLRRLVYPFAAGYIFQTRQQKEYFPAHVRARGIVLPNPLDASRLPDAYTGARQKRVVSAGRLEPQKNFPLLITAFSMFVKTHPGWTLTVYGEGTERERLETLCASLGVSACVSLPGRTDALASDIRCAGMFVLPSDFEGMPNALIEAMATGLPAVATNCPAGGCEALITDGENGLLVPVSNAAALVRAMARISDDPALSQRLSHAACCVREQMNVGIVSKQWRAYIESVAR